jgi:hypothetical protein
VYGRLLPLLMGLLLTGCDDRSPADAQGRPPAPAAEGAAFDPASAGDVTGQVVWEGAAPEVPPYRAPANPLSEPSPRRGLRDWPNPCAPAIDSSGGVGGGVVFLRGVDPRVARPWDLPPVRVELANWEIRVHQGDAVGRCGFVRRGAFVDFLSSQSVFHSLRAEGAACFAVPFADPNVVRRRTLGRGGVVELTSGAGYYWMRGYLFVLDHPYVALTDDRGRFTLRQVPAGRYELVAWHPNWQEAGHSRDGDTCQIWRLTLRPPLEVVRAVAVGAGQTSGVRITFPPNH